MIMALYDNYITNNDKPFAENINDALLLSNVFDMTVDVEAPKMFSNSTWVSTTSPRKCGVSILTLKEGLPSGVSVGTDSTTGNSTLTGTGTVKLSWYPNFNSFGKFKAINWENDGTVVVNLKTSNGTTIASNISKGTINNQSSELRTLQEIVIEIVMTNATLKSLTVVMENKQQERYGATVGITDVTGLDDRLDAIEDSVFVELTSSNYNATIDTDFTITAKVVDLLGDVVSGKSITLYHDGTSVSSKTTNSSGEATWTITPTSWGLHDFHIINSHCQVIVDGWRTILGSVGDSFYAQQKADHIRFVLSGWGETTTATTSWTVFGSGAKYLENFEPKNYIVCLNSWGTTLFRINTDGTIAYRSLSGTVSSTKHYIQIDYTMK